MLVNFFFGILIGVVLDWDATELLSAVFLKLVEAVSVLWTELLYEGQTPLRPYVLRSIETSTRPVLASRLLVKILDQGWERSHALSCKLIRTKSIVDIDSGRALRIVVKVLFVQRRALPLWDNCCLDWCHFRLWFHRHYFFYFGFHDIILFLRFGFLDILR